MLTIDFSSLHKIHGRHGLTAAEFRKSAKNLNNFLKEFSKKDQGFCAALDDQKTLREIEKFARKITNHKSQIEFIVVLGIGGSALSTASLHAALYTTLNSARHPDLFILDNIDPSEIVNLESLIDLKRTLFIVVTKSGATPETLATYLYFRDKIDRKKLNPRAHFAFVTDPKKGFLRFIGDREGIPTFSIPPNVVGRFSVLTAVGLLPAALMGLNISALVRGARKMRDRFLSKKFEDNLPFQLAAAQYLLYEKGKTGHVLMPYSSCMSGFADWYCQLLAESTGKEKKRFGRIVNVGITPIRAVGVTDQHSQLQLWNHGPNDKLVMFLNVKHKGAPIRIPKIYEHEESFQYLHGRTFSQMMDAEMAGTQQSLIRHDRPSFTISIDRVDEEHLGMLFMLFMGATAFLGEFFGINAFDQPGVELGKKLTKEILSEH